MDTTSTPTPDIFHLDLALRAASHAASHPDEWEAASPAPPQSFVDAERAYQERRTHLRPRFEAALSERLAATTPRIASPQEEGDSQPPDAAAQWRDVIQRLEAYQAECEAQDRVKALTKRS